MLLLSYKGGEYMSSEDRKYYRACAAIQREMVKVAPGDQIAAIHEDLARIYEALADAPTKKPKLRIAF